MKIHFVGCEGVSMKALANIMKSYGHTISGSDIVLCGHDGKNVDGADVVVYTTAVGENNVEVKRARQIGLPVFERAAFLGDVAKNYANVIAVCGSHGKTTATGFLEQIFLPLESTVHIGGKTNGESGHIGGREHFITEACEYKRSFLHLHSDIAVVLNIELDHTDYFSSLDDYSFAFKEFLGCSKRNVINGDDVECLKIKNENSVTFGLKKNNDYQARNVELVDGVRGFDVYKNQEFFLKAEITLHGEHNIYNALAALAAADISGVSKELILEGLKNFTGVKRRFEYVGKVEDSFVYTDYAHHPSEIKTTVCSAKEITQKRVTVVFEPHTYSRTKSLMSEFCRSLSIADRIILVPIFAAREEPLEGVTSNVIVRELISGGSRAIHFDTFEEVCSYLKSTKEKDEIIVFTGAGDIYKCAYLMVGSV